MATFTYVPSYSTESSQEPRLRKAQFGDGYAQRVLDGINAMPLRWNLVFADILAADATTIIQFFRDNAAVPFDWTPPNESAGKYVCVSWKRSFTNFQQTVTAVFEQDFAP